MNNKRVYPEQSRRTIGHTPISIGIVGGGQLGRMLSYAAKKLGFTITILDPIPLSPAGQVADKQILAPYHDKKALYELATLSDVITVEVEVTDEEGLQSILEDITQKGTPVEPSPETFRIIQDKLKQKEFLQQHNIPTAAFISVSSETDIKNAARTFGYPLLLKARTGAYDGKGNFVIENEKDIAKGLEKLKNRALYVEKFVTFTHELAVMVARNTIGEIAVYPVAETIHKDNICDTVIVPARVSTTAIKNAEKLAVETVKKLQAVGGVFGIEMFVEKDDNVLINELAPRVHNSGHYSIEACVTSQFEQHIRAITGLPLGKTTLLCKAVVMKNILGESQGLGFPKGFEKALSLPNVSVHLYGKQESRVGRKMGHITVVGDNVESCLKTAEEARKFLAI